MDILRSNLGLLCLGKSDYQAVAAMWEDDYFKQGWALAGHPQSSGCVDGLTRLERGLFWSLMGVSEHAEATEGFHKRLPERSCPAGCGCLSLDSVVNRF